VTEDNRITEIRAVLDGVDNARRSEFSDLVEALRRIRDLTADSAPSAPRVFFRGDSVPAGTYLLNCGGGVIMPPDEPWKVIGGTYVELPVMTPEEWQAAVDRATSARAIPEPTEGQNP
jgi:hypothetical protein